MAKAAKDNTPSFGKANKGLPSWFARVPTKAIHNREITHGEIRVLAAICCYANNQGFAWPNQSTIHRDTGCSEALIARAMVKLQKQGVIEIVSRHRSHPKWRRVMGNVYRIIHDERLETDKLIDEMNNEATPPPIKETPVEKADAETISGNHGEASDAMQLVEALALTHWYAKRAEASHGQLRLANPRAIDAAHALIVGGHTVEEIKAQALDVLKARRNAGRDAPHHLGDGVVGNKPDDRQVN